MRRITSALFFLALAALSLPADEPKAAEKKPDEPKPAEKKPAAPTKIDWGNYVDHIPLAGEIDKLSETGFKLKVTTYIPQPPVNRRPQPPKPHVEHYELLYHDQAFVRYATLPVRLDEKGKKLPYTDKEKLARKLPTSAGIAGYTADRSELTAGTLVEVMLMRPKGTKLADLVTSDYRIKHVTIVGGETAKPGEKKDGEKKEEKKEK